jgi:hypothetical protein
MKHRDTTDLGWIRAEHRGINELCGLSQPRHGRRAKPEPVGFAGMVAAISRALANMAASAATFTIRWGVPRGR